MKQFNKALVHGLALVGAIYLSYKFVIYCILNIN
jgi:hypothetical protein